MKVAHDLAAGFMLLTRIPVPATIQSTSTPDLKRSLWTYPLVGTVVSGSGAAVLYAATALGLPMTAAVLLAMASTIWLTGAFHEDGLADMADGLGGGQTVEKKLEIMHDSRLGTYGTATLVMVLLLKATILSSLTISQAIIGMVATGALSRMGIVLLLWILPPARPESLATVAGKPGPAALVVALATGISIAFVCGGYSMGGVVITGTLIGTLFTGLLAYRQIGGFTGDVLGASQQISELVGLLALLGLASIFSA